MIRLTSFLRRNPLLSLEDFHEFLRCEYGPLVAAHQTPLGILRYTQTHLLEDASSNALRGQMEEPYDAVCETWWASLEVLSEALASQRGKQANAALIAAQTEMIDSPESPLWLAHEYPQFSQTKEHLVARPSSPLVKVHMVIRQVPTMTFDQAQVHWRTVHGPFVRSLSSSMDALKYQQVHRYETHLEAELRAMRGVTVDPYLGHAEVWQNRSSSLLTQTDYDRMKQSVVEDEARFIDFSRSAVSLGKEHVFIDHF